MPFFPFRMSPKVKCVACGKVLPNNHAGRGQWVAPCLRCGHEYAVYFEK